MTDRPEFQDRGPQAASPNQNLKHEGKPMIAVSLQDAESLAWKGAPKPNMSPDLQAFLTGFVDPFFRAGEACNGYPPPYSGPRWQATATAYARAREAMYAEWSRLTGSGRQAE